MFCPVERPWRSRSRRGRGLQNGFDSGAREGRGSGKESQSCTLEFLFTGDGPGGAVMDVGGESASERVGSRDLGRGGNRGSRREKVVTAEIEVIVPLLDLGGTNRSRSREMPKVAEKAEIRGGSRRKLPH